MRTIFYENIFYNLDKIVHFCYEATENKYENEMHILFDNNEELSIKMSPREYNKVIDYIIDDSQKIISMHSL